MQEGLHTGSHPHPHTLHVNIYNDIYFIHRRTEAMQEGLHTAIHTPPYRFPSPCHASPTGQYLYYHVIMIFIIPTDVRKPCRKVYTPLYRFPSLSLTAGQYLYYHVTIISIIPTDVRKPCRKVYTPLYRFPSPSPASPTACGLHWRNWQKSAISTANQIYRSVCILLHKGLFYAPAMKFCDSVLPDSVSAQYLCHRYTNEIRYMDVSWMNLVAVK